VTRHHIAEEQNFQAFQDLHICVR